MSLGRWMKAGIVALGVSGLAACGSNNNNTGPAIYDVELSAGPSNIYSHIWVTISGIAMNANATEIFDANDMTWAYYTLAEPVTVDLNDLDNGTMRTVLSNLHISSGNYLQTRLLLTPTNQPLTSSAQAKTDGNGQALQWNDQIEYMQGSTRVEVPLEVPADGQGLFVDTAQILGAGGTYDTDFDIDIVHSIVPFQQGNGLGFYLQPQLQTHVLSLDGAVQGNLATTSLCPRGTTGSNCAGQVIAMAELPHYDAAGNITYQAVREAAVDPTTGVFELYPLEPSTTVGLYQIVIHGLNMRTMVITNVPVVTGTTPSSLSPNAALAVYAPTMLNVSPIPVTLTQSAYSAQLSQPMTPYGAGHVLFTQTPTLTDVPSEIRWASTDPFTGLFNTPVALDGDTMEEAIWVSLVQPTFAAVAPYNGSGNFGAFSMGTVYQVPAVPGSVIAAGAAGSTVDFAPVAPIQLATVPNGQVTATFTVTNAEGYDRGQLVMSDIAGIVNSADISGLLGGSGGSSNCSTATMSCTIEVPVGSSALLTPGTYYYPYLRLWKSSSSAPATLVDINTPVNLMAGGNGSFSVNIP